MSHRTDPCIRRLAGTLVVVLGFCSCVTQSTIHSENQLKSPGEAPPSKKGAIKPKGSIPERGERRFKSSALQEPEPGWVNDRLTKTRQRSSDQFVKSYELKSELTVFKHAKDGWMYLQAHGSILIADRLERSASDHTISAFGKCCLVQSGMKVYSTDRDHLGKAVVIWDVGKNVIDFNHPLNMASE